MNNTPDSEGRFYNEENISGQCMGGAFVRWIEQFNFDKGTLCVSNKQYWLAATNTILSVNI